MTLLLGLSAYAAQQRLKQRWPAAAGDAPGERCCATLFFAIWAIKTWQPSGILLTLSILTALPIIRALGRTCFDRLSPNGQAISPDKDLP